ncbi:MAG TPA: hypothetical protein VFE39_03840 [Pseudonocardia sp.]|nr:hypothetical protein [Pseudonocardia sp.]
MVVAADLIQRVPSRRLTSPVPAAFALASAVAALAPNITWFTAGRTLRGAATGICSSSHSPRWSPVTAPRASR